MPFRREQLYFALFFLLWMGNSILSHVVARGFLETAQQAAVLRAEGVAPETQIEVREENLAQGAGLLFTNIPLFLGLGWIVRADQPSAGPFYWALVVLGSFYVPLFLTMCAFFLFNPPGRGFQLPGTVADSEYLEDEDDHDDHR